MLKILFLILAITLFIPTSRAMEITFEPYLGPHVLGTFDEGGSNGMSGFGIGAKAGVLFMTSFLSGIEISSAAMKVDKNPKEDHEQQGVGVFGGMIIPLLPMRAFLTYYPLYIDRISGGRRLSGNAVKLGMGISPLPFPVSFNMEYLIASFGEQRSNGTTSKLSPEASSQVLIFSVSFPLSSPI